MRASASDSGSVPNRSMPAAAQVGPFRSTRSNRTCLCLFLLSSRIKLMDVSSVKPSSCGCSSGHTSTKGAAICEFSASRHVEVAQQDCVVDRAERAVHPTKLATAQSGGRLATVEM